MGKKKVKPIKFPYKILSQDEPLAPLLNIDLIVNRVVVKRNILALLDSGAGITLIPQDIIEEVQPQIIDISIRFGFTGGEAKSLLYALKIRVPRIGAWYTKAVGYPGLNYVLIGRDILNRWSLFLKGRSKIFEIS